MLIDFRELFPKYGIKPKGVLHVGANRGEEFPVYMELGITRQIWIEANPEIYEQLKDTIKSNPDALAYNYAMGDVDSVPTILHVSNNGSQSSSILELGTHKEQHPDVHYIKDIPVTMRRVDCLMPELIAKNYDFLNIDVQGFEFQVLKGMGEYLDYIKWAYLEVNRDKVYKDCALVYEIDRFLFDIGFERVETKWVGNWGDALYIKNQK